jgi:hypothetical protein
MQTVSERFSEQMGRRSFLRRAVTMSTVFLFPGFYWSPGFGATRRGYVLAPESLLPYDIRQAPLEVREAYRFAIANREILRYIPCYCGCGEEGHTSNASCYLKDFSTPGNLVFDRMSLN